MTRGEVIVSLIIFLGVFLFVFLFLAKDGANLLFSPGDSRLFNFSSNCRQITITDNSKTSPATLYLVTENLALTKQNPFKIYHASLSIDQANYEYWQYFLYPNSHFNMTVCSNSKLNAQFYIIKGSQDFKRWTKGKNVQNEAFLNVVYSCDDKHELEFTASYQEEYFFVFHNPSTYVVDIKLDMTFERYLPVPPFYDVPSCSTSSTGSCTLQVPTDQSYKILITTDVASDVDWEENVAVSWACENRASSYVKAVLDANVLFSLGIVMIVSALAVVYYRVQPSNSR